MQSYHVELQSPVFNTFRCNRAADSVDIDVEEKSKHELRVSADMETDFHVGLIVGSSGSGKTTLAQRMFEDCNWEVELDPSKAIIDQFPEDMTYEQCVHALTGVGLTSVPCWIRPAHTLSTGQKARAIAALSMCADADATILDEWTSVVDRTVGKIMSHCVQKFARRNNKQVVFISCHYDVIEWLDPDWIIDCNKATYTDRRLLQRGQRNEKLTFDIRPVERNTWRHFKKYHYLTDKLPPTRKPALGLFSGDDQIGCNFFTNYVPHRKGTKLILHSNRTVVHPDYCGFALGVRLCNCSCAYMKRLYDCRVMGKFSNGALYTAFMKDPNWELREIKRQVGKLIVGGNMIRRSGFRQNVRTYSFEFVGDESTVG